VVSLKSKVESGKYQISIVNAEGNEIYNGKDKEFNTAELVSGRYLVQVKTDK
jgi:hypothetical protein